MNTLSSFGRITLLGACLFCCSIGGAAADTPVSGTISTNTTWTTAGSPYVLTGSVLVEGTGTPVLTIQPGVTVKFNSGAELVISYNNPGALLANGTSGSPILFTANGSTTPGFWKGLYIGNKTPATTTQISYATVEYGGQTTWTRGGIHVWSLSPTFSNLTARNNVVAGITVNGGAPAITATTLTGNSGPGLLVSTGSPTMSASTVSSNTGYGINVAGGSLDVGGTTISNNTDYAISGLASSPVTTLTGMTISGNGSGKDLVEKRAATISASQTWPLSAVAYVVTGSVYVEASGTPVLTIPAGVTVKFNSGAELVVSYNNPGALIATGTSGSPILFTANGSTTPGFWKGLYIGNKTPATTTQISYATVEYGGWTFWTRGGIHVRSIAPTLDHLTLRNNVVAGLSVDLGAPSVTNCTFLSNSAGLITTAGTSPLNARLNWWGATSGPSGSGPGTGQSVPSGVSFDPWLTAPGSSPEYVSSATYSNRKFNPSSGTISNWSLASSQSASWTMTFSNSQSQVVRTLTASGLTAPFSWDGKNDSGVLQPDGTYTYTIQATAGSSATPATGRAFVDSTLLLSITTPAASQTLSNVYQNGSTDVTVAGTVRMSGLTSWTLEYGSGSSPSSWTSINTGTQAVVANTIGTWATLPLAVGLYSLRVRASDDQANAFTTAQTDTVGNFTVSQGATLQINPPAGNTVSYTSIVPFTLTETLLIKNGAGQVVRTLANATRPATTYTDVWNGKNDSAAFLPDGPYFYFATVTDGTHTFTWDQTNQYYNDWSTEQNLSLQAWDPFNNSPLILSYNFSQPGRVNIALKQGDGGGCAPPSFCLAQDKYEESGPHTIAWAGVDSTGALRFDLNWNANSSGRAIFSKNAVVLYGTKPSVSNVTVTPPIYGPAAGTQTVAFDLLTFQNQAVTVTLTFLNQDSLSILRTIALAGQSSGHKTVSWDGHADSGGLMPPGNYTVTVATADSLGNQAQSQILTAIQY